MSELRVKVIAVPSVCKAKTQKGDKIIVYHFDHKVSEIVLKQLKEVIHDICGAFTYFIFQPPKTLHYTAT